MSVSPKLSLWKLLTLLPRRTRIPNSVLPAVINLVRPTCFIEGEDGSY